MRSFLIDVKCFIRGEFNSTWKLKRLKKNFNSTQWPQEALISVSMRFLNIMSVIPAGIKGSVAQFMAYVHGSVNEISKVKTAFKLYSQICLIKAKYSGRYLMWSFG